MSATTSVSSLHVSLLFSLQILSCLPILRKICFHFTVLLKPACPFCLVPAWVKAAPALLPFLPVVSFPVVLKDYGARLPGCPFRPVLPSLQLPSILTCPSVGLHDTSLCFSAPCLLSDCLVLPPSACCWFKIPVLCTLLSLGGPVWAHPSL